MKLAVCDVVLPSLNAELRRLEGFGERFSATLAILREARDEAKEKIRRYQDNAASSPMRD